MALELSLRVNHLSPPRERVSVYKESISPKAATRKPLVQPRPSPPHRALAGASRGAGIGQWGWSLAGYLVIPVLAAGLVAALAMRIR